MGSTRWLPGPPTWKMEKMAANVKKILSTVREPNELRIFTVHNKIWGELVTPTLFTFWYLYRLECITKLGTPQWFVPREVTDNDHDSIRRQTNWKCLCFQILGHDINLQSVVSLRRFALRNFAHMNFYNEAHTLRLARHPNANLMARNLPNKI
jgi:hypothetical protein